MPDIHVCPLNKLARTAKRTGASHIATLINADTRVDRPYSVSPDNHLFLAFNDINTAMDGMTLAGEDHMVRYLDFIRNWDRQKPMIVHCWAGVSRSTAGAMIALCALRPDLDEQHVADTIRARSPEATPNQRLITLADAMLGRDGRMLAAVQSIGRGADCFEGSVFQLTVGTCEGDAI